MDLSSGWEKFQARTDMSNRQRRSRSTLCDRNEHDQFRIFYGVFTQNLAFGDRVPSTLITLR